MAAKRRRNKLKGENKMAIYLQVDYKTGDLYEYSKLEKRRLCGKH
jgi:hypothetical protein